MLPEEPNVDGREVTKIVLRLETGEKRSRRFLTGDKVQILYDFARASGQRGKFDLIINFPKKVLADRQATLEEAGLVPSASVFVSVE